MDFDKSEYEYGVGQLATAQRELQDAAMSSKSPAELRSKSYAIVTEYQKRAKANKENRDALVGAGRIRYPTVKSLQNAQASGKLTREELAVHLDYLEAQAQQRNPPTHASR